MSVFSKMSCPVSVVVLKRIREVASGPLRFLCNAYICMLFPFMSLVLVSVFCMSVSVWSSVVSLNVTWLIQSQGRLSVLSLLSLVICMYSLLPYMLVGYVFMFAMYVICDASDGVTITPPLLYIRY